jgi:hypothetical protein
VVRGGLLVLSDHHAALFNEVYRTAELKEWVVDTGHMDGPLKLAYEEVCKDDDCVPLLSNSSSLVQVLSTPESVSSGPQPFDEGSRLILELDPEYTYDDILRAVANIEGASRPVFVEAQIGKGWIVYTNLHLRYLRNGQLPQMMLDGPVRNNYRPKQVAKQLPSLLRLPHAG